LYGNPKADNESVYKAAEIANALEFIESAELKNAFEDNAIALHEEFVKREASMR